VILKAMYNPQKINLLMAAIPLGLVLLVILVSQVEFGTVLSPAERELLHFRGEPVPAMVPREPLALGPVQSPVPLVFASDQGFPPEPLADVAPPGERPPAGDRQLNLSLIVINRGKKFAIISGAVVKEGDVVDQRRILRIERNQVLLKDKEGERWLKID
jgi:hypothetical protein